MSQPSIDEGGFTLIEVVIGLFILTIIMGALAIVTLTAFKSTSNSLTLLNNSHDRQLLALYFQRDALSGNDATVLSASTLENPGSPHNIKVLCANAPSGTTATNTTVLQLTWQGLPPQSTGTSQSAEYFAADYAVVPGTSSNSALQLKRYYCASPTPPATATVNSYPELLPDTVVASGLATPTASTYPAYAQCLSGGSGTDCVGSLSVNVSEVSDRAFQVSAEMRSSST